ncbi:hypothetical protein GALMADRAFT_253783 [Galerina marginata CBS 339.88]|uniref:Uncharacterized protein n=1 Tax=Galerina marginata (strain CBS 339.88) TaxID=685588 RepID=A0A067SKN7_GALM3|nr:hypothetical protein GALMADRAFT_253783 [Galerina marginata CBS 339.88]
MSGLTPPQVPQLALFWSLISYPFQSGSTVECLWLSWASRTAIEAEVDIQLDAEAEAEAATSSMTLGRPIFEFGYGRRVGLLARS